ncbi:gluconokinase [Jannaschia sp. Os4]|uniref:gluconokinase n=1 Tax=Jannaschia sp. Os4 TaxID=2807617 RepID=UPI0019393BA2|nr:gluconokinase [Jannaschia sp. Os4]MBM2577043.1 gluconokinase [Jannaschia sp. Os4]
MKVIVMGVTSTGKSLTGAMLAEALGGRFVDGDDLHPEANRAKMARGTPLTDADRWPWLDAIGAEMARAEGPVVVACSALKAAYRRRIEAAAGAVAFVHLHGPKAVIAARMAAREGHFMPVSLLDSQLETLEMPGPDECARTFDLREPPEVIVRQAAAWVRTVG